MPVAIDDIYTKIEKIPSLPVIVTRLLAIVDDTDTKISDLVELVGADIGITARVMRLVNSAAYGQQRRIGNLRKAIPLMGMRNLKEIVLSISLMDATRSLEKNRSGMDANAFWLHSYACGAAAREIAPYYNIKEQEEVFIAGLIHDIGKIVQAQHAPEQFKQTVELGVEREEQFYKVEPEVFDTLHTRIGGMLARRWDLPEKFIYCARFHHGGMPRTIEAEDFRPIVRVVMVADQLAKSMRMGFSGCRQMKSLDSIFSALGIHGSNDRLKITDGVRDSVEQFRQMLLIESTTAAEDRHVG